MVSVCVVRKATNDTPLYTREGEGRCNEGTVKRWTLGKAIDGTYVTTQTVQDGVVNL